MSDQVGQSELIESLIHVLKRQARARKRGQQLTLQTTEIVHETYLRLAQQVELDWQDRETFLIAFASTLRRFLIDNHRRRTAAKRGGHQHNLDVDELQIAFPVPDGIENWDVLETRLAELQGVDPVAHRIVELRYFAGLTLDELANTLHISTRTVTRKWTFARSYLKARLESDLD